APRTPRALLLVLTALVVSRALWIALVPTQPIDDFAWYHDTASRLASGAYRAPRWPSCSLLSAWGYPLFLARIYARLGSSLLVAALCNLVLGAGAAGLLFLLAQRLFGAPTALLAALLFALWPGQLMFTSVVASEHLAVVLELAALLLLAVGLAPRSAEPSD